MINFLGRTADRLYNKVCNRSKSSNQQRPNKEPEDFYLTRRKLPPNFADDLLNLEIDLEQGKYTIGNINKLIELYSAAIEYYESIVSNKHYIFQNKLKTLMANPRVISVINEEYTKKNMGKKEPFILSQQQKAEQFHQEFLKTAAKELPMGRMRESLSQKVAAVHGIINGQITNQQDLIMKRLEERKNKANRPKSQPPSTRPTEEDEKTPVFSKKKDDSPSFKPANNSSSRKSLYKDNSPRKSLNKFPQKEGSPSIKPEKKHPENQESRSNIFKSPSIKKSPENRKTEDDSPQSKIKISQQMKVDPNPQPQPQPERKLSRQPKANEIAFKLLGPPMTVGSPSKNDVQRKSEANPKFGEPVKKEEKSESKKDSSTTVAFKVFKKPPPKNFI